MDLQKKLFKSPLTYSVLVDIIIITLVIATGFILSETFLPGIVSAYISPFILFASIYIILIAIVFIAHKQKISFPAKERNLLLFILSTIIFGALIVIAGFRFSIIVNSISTIFCITIFILFYNIFRDKTS